MKLGDSDWFGCVFSVIILSFSFLVESRSLEDRFLGSLGSLVVVCLLELLGWFICLIICCFLVCFLLAHYG